MAESGAILFQYKRAKSLAVCGCGCALVLVLIAIGALVIFYRRGKSAEKKAEAPARSSSASGFKVNALASKQVGSTVIESTDGTTTYTSTPEHLPATLREPKTIALFETVAAELSKKVFRGSRIVVHLCDEHLRSLRVVSR